MRATTLMSAVRSAALGWAACALFACEQDPDVVISTAPLDAGKQVQQQDPPAMNDEAACHELASRYIQLTKVFESEALSAQVLAQLMAVKQSCVWRVNDADANRALEVIFDGPPAEVRAEDDTVVLCNVIDRFLDGGIAGDMQARAYPWPDFDLIPEFVRLCPGYCVALEAWITANKPAFESCALRPSP